LAEPIRFPDVAVYTGFNQTVRAETDVRDLEVVQGAIPDSFEGTLYRVGPDPRYPARLGDDEWTNGDGHVVMFRFENGHVDLKTRYVRTERLRWRRRRVSRCSGAIAIPTPTTRV
jgi:carotenoid cleavage dioxygenase